MIIGIDIDDTILNTYEVMMTYAQEYTINDLKKEPRLARKCDFTTHCYIQNLLDWAPIEDKNFMDKYYIKVIKKAQAKFLASEYLHKLQDEGNKIVLITARYSDSKADVKKITETSLRKNNIPFDKLIIDATDKLEVAKRENVDIFIDDSYSNCLRVNESNIKVLLMESRGNQTLETNEFPKVYTWPHVYMKIKEIEENL